VVNNKECNQPPESEENPWGHQETLQEITDINHNSHPLVELSAFKLAEISTLPKQRKERYSQHITKLIKTVFEDINNGNNSIPIKDDKHPALNIPSLDTQKMDYLNQQICKACQGRCCLNAGDHSYLQVETIKRYATQHPNLSPEQIKQNYAHRIPEKTHNQSCLNHTQTGCALPKEMRSDVCNNFYCSTIKEFNINFSLPPTIPDGAVIMIRSHEQAQIHTVKIDC